MAKNELFFSAHIIEVAVALKSSYPDVGQIEELLVEFGGGLWAQLRHRLHHGLHGPVPPEEARQLPVSLCGIEQGEESALSPEQGEKRNRTEQGEKSALSPGQNRERNKTEHGENQH